MGRGSRSDVGYHRYRRFGCQLRIGNGYVLDVVWVWGAKRQGVVSDVVSLCLCLCLCGGVVCQAMCLIL